MQFTTAIFLFALFSTIFCTAVNCYTYRLAYPLWLKIRAEEFAALHQEYLRQLTPVITLPHIVMFFSSLALLRWYLPVFGFTSALVLFTLNASVVLISVFAAGPIHDRFTREGRLEGPGVRRLLVISAARSILMLAASGLLCRTLWTVVVLTAIQAPR